MADELRGIKTALALALDAHAAAAGDAEADGDLFGAAVAPGQPAGKVGRPNGARNRSTEARRIYLMGKHGDPLEEALRIGMMTTHQIAKELGLRRYVTTADGTVDLGPDLQAAAREKRGYLDTVQPYFGQKLPVAIEAVGKERGVLILGDLTTAAFAEQGLALPLAPAEQNQEVTDLEPVTSDADASDDNVKSLIDKDNPTDAA